MGDASRTTGSEPASLELDRVGGGQRDLVNDRARQRIGRELVLIAVVSRDSIHGHDNVEAAQGGRDCREQDPVMRRGADQDDGCDPLVLEYLMQARVLVAEDEL